MTDLRKLAWSCDERGRAKGERRNAHGCHCAEIADLQHASAAKDAEIARLREALSAACGYMRNAAIDLGTGAPKKTALATVEGGLKLAEATLKEPSHG